MRRLGIIFIVFLASCLALNSGPQRAQAAPQQTGLILDAARQYYSVTTLKRFIREVHVGGGRFLQLHLTDDTRFGLENAHLGQTVKAARKKGQVYYNRRNRLAFLSKAQLKTLVAYGHKHSVEVIPEIDTPGHTRALIQLLRVSSPANRKLATRIAAHHELNLHAKETLPFVKRLLGEYVGLLRPGQHLAIGGDEYSSAAQPNQPNTVTYTNGLSHYLRQHHLKTMMWNDGLMRADLPHLDHHILVTYWSYDGESASAKLSRQRRRLRATLPQLNAAGFQTINANFWYLYVITQPKTFTTANRTYWQRDLKTNWTPQIWDKTNQSARATSPNNLGSAISIWGDGKKTYSQKQVYRLTRPFLTTYFTMTRTTPFK
ncbi:family 20 glycosylhydrolase [Levilactobacillus suantsaii]|uniref:Glycoside hydrolase family 20 catalytic domain-containing protein n=1 Tax=Levilactobacillus suantsaii TaxID=2292255 RepID=A0A4V1LF46_9LACO|nr:family 20 glycosylhydrolase [Levilactobacillus suantsaii]QMU08845.1 family 20 glycosylhydrolase [Levilactobacillus suantsaii]RXI76128.1 hypothetical protein DXH47_10885 [Levilactobacillus suantsaii]